MQKTPAMALLVAIFLLMTPVAIDAQDYSLDSSFGTAGKVWGPEGPYGYNEFYYRPAPRVLVLEDGKILHISTTGTGIMITRYLPGGTIDSSFGNSVPGSYTGTFGNGSVQYIYNSNPARSPQTAVAAAALPGGGFLVAGTVTTGTTRAFALARYLANGSPDPAFGQSGMVVTHAGEGHADLAAMALQTDGKIVVAGTAVRDSVKVFAMARYLPGGSLDNSFDSDGIAYTAYGEKDATAAAVTVQLDGKIVVAGEVQNVVYHDRFGYPTGPQYKGDAGLVRLNSDGSVDATFGTGGRATLQTYIETEDVNGMALQPDGKIVISGMTQYQFTIFFTMRFTATGAPDTTFGRTGEQLYTFGFDGGFNHDIGILEDGTILYTVNDAATFSSQDVWLFKVPPGGVLTPFKYYSVKEHSSTGNPGSVEFGGSMAQQGNRLVIGALSRFRAYESGSAPDVTKASLFRIKSNARLLSRNPVQYYRDEDGDGYGNNAVTTIGYTAPAGYVIPGGDCNDGDPSVFPGAKEIADGKDNDCNGVADDVVIYTVIPAKMEAERYYQEKGTVVEGTTDAGGGQNIGYIDWGDWLDYAISVPATGTYTARFRVASDNDNPAFRVYNQRGQVLATVTVPATGGWQNWTTVAVELNLLQGPQVLRILSTTTQRWNFNWLEFVPPPLPASYVRLPARVEAEDFSDMIGVQTEPVQDSGGGLNVGYIDRGDVISYNVSVAEPATYTVSFRVAAMNTGATFVLHASNGRLDRKVTVPATGGWQSWKTISEDVFLPAGDYTLSLISTGPEAWNINWLDFSPRATPAPYVVIPAFVEAEDYTAQQGVQIEACDDIIQGKNVGYIDWGDWMEYKINVPAAGYCWVLFRIATPSVTHPQFVLKSDNTVLAVVDVPYTGGFQQWQTLTIPINLPKGNQVIRIESTGGGYWNLNWLQFTYVIPVASAAGLQDKASSSTASLPGGVTVYPNPVRNILTLQVANDYSGPVSAEVVDISGRIVKRFALNKRGRDLQATLPLYGTPAGTYFIRVTTRDQTTIIKVVKE